MVRDGNEKRELTMRKEQRGREKGRRDRIRGIGEGMDKRDGERDRDDKKGKRIKRKGEERKSREREAEG